jgi:hypothetical protein
MPFSEDEILKPVVPAPRRKRAPKADREATVLHECLVWLYGRHVACWRNNTGATVLPDGRFLRYGLSGSPDIIGVLPKTGRFFGVECKSRTGKQTHQQKSFQTWIEASGGAYYLVRSLAELQARFPS